MPPRLHHVLTVHEDPRAGRPGNLGRGRSRRPSQVLPLVLLLCGLGCKQAEPEPAASAPRATPSEGCTGAPLLESDRYEELLLAEYVWDPLVAGLLTEADRCPTQRFELYDLETRERIAQHALPTIPSKRGRDVPWEFGGFVGGHAWLTWRAPLEPRSDVILVRLSDGKKTLDTRERRTEATGDVAHFFTDVARYVHPTPEAIYIDLADGGRVALDPDSGTLARTSVEPPHRHDIAKRHGCDFGYGNWEDGFKSADGRSTSAGGTTAVTELRPDRIRFAEKDGKTTLTFLGAREGGSIPRGEYPVLMKTKDAFFEPKILIPAECSPSGAARKIPAPLLVSHASDLDQFSAGAMLSRVSADGVTKWTIDLPKRFDASAKVRYFGSTIFALYEYENLGVWVDIEAGTITTQMKLGSRWVDPRTPEKRNR